MGSDNETQQAENKECDTKEYEFDELLTKQVGEYGRWQKIAVGLLITCSIATVLQIMTIVFTGDIPDHWCEIKTDAIANCSEEQMKTLMLPKEKNGFSHCHIYTANYSEKQVADYCSSDENISLGNQTTQECHSWQYEYHVSQSIVSEWDLVCEKSSFSATVSACVMVGRVIGCLVAGQICNKFGRRIPLLISQLLLVAADVLTCLMPNYIGFLIVRLFSAFFMVVSDVACILLAIEFVGPSWRVFVSVMWLYIWAAGYVLLAGIGYFIRGWRHLYAVCTIPETLLLVAYFIFIPESPRWLLVNNRKKEAMKIICKIANGNGKPLPDNITAHAQKENVSGTYLDLLKTPWIRWTTIILVYSWITNGFVYYGLALNSSNLGGNKYINFLISGAVEFPAYTLIWWSFNRFGRVKPYAISLVAAGVSLLLITCVPKDVNWLLITFAMIGKFAISATFGMAWIYTMEVYPTSIRALGVTLCSLFARVASVPASYVGMLAEISRELPLVIFGAMALLGGILFFFLPETHNVPMKQTVKEGEDFIKENMCKYQLCRRYRKKPQVKDMAEINMNLKC